MPRPKGAPNKSTKDLREFVQAFLESNKHRIQSDFEELTPAERLRFIERLLPFVMPKFTSLTVSEGNNENTVNLPSWFDEE